MPLSIYGTGSITFLLGAFPFPAFASAVIWINEVMLYYVLIIKNTALNWNSTDLEVSPGVAVHSDFLSRVIHFSIICAGTLLLCNAAPFTIWQQATRTYTARDTTGTGLYTVIAKHIACHAVPLHNKNIEQQSWSLTVPNLHSLCPVSGSFFDTLILGYLVSQLSSRRKPWDGCMLITIIACYTGHHFMFAQTVLCIEGRVPTFG